MNIYLQIILFLVLASLIHGVLEEKLKISRWKRAGGKVTVPLLIRPPARLKKGESVVSPPGWKHCIKRLIASDKWRIITSASHSNTQATQFQCTWIITVRQSAEKRQNKQIQLSVQRLNLNNKDNDKCQHDFLEIIDAKKSQGRFCDKQKPGDYVSIGSSVRVDVQGGNILVNRIKKKKKPFIVSYRTVDSIPPGFRIYTSKVKRHDYDKFHASTKGIWKENPSKPVKPKRGDPKDKNKDNSIGQNKFGNLPLPGLIVVITSCTLILLIVFVIIAKRLLCNHKRKKHFKDPLTDVSVEEDNDHVFSSCDKPLTLPRHTSHSDVSLKITKSSIQNEVIVDSAVIQPNNVKKSTSDPTKKSFSKPMQQNDVKAPDRSREKSKSRLPNREKCKTKEDKIKNDFSSPPRKIRDTKHSEHNKRLHNRELKKDTEKEEKKNYFPTRRAQSTDKKSSRKNLTTKDAKADTHSQKRKKHSLVNEINVSEHKKKEKRSKPSKGNSHSSNQDRSKDSKDSKDSKNSKDSKDSKKSKTSDPTPITRYRQKSSR